MQDFTILTTFRDNQACLDRLLGAFEKFAPTGTRVIVVDSASKISPTLPLSSRLRFEVHLNPKGTLTSSINAGLRKIDPSCRWTWIFDADAYPLDEALFELPTFASDLPNLGLIAPRSVGSDGRPTAYFENRPITISRYLFGPVGMSFFERLLPPKEAPHSGGGHSKLQTARTVFSQCILLPTRLLLDIEGFDEEFVAWGCDNDLSMRIRKSGRCLYIAPSYRVEHDGGSSLKGASNERILLEHKAFARLMRKHHSILLPLLRPLVLLRHAVELAAAAKRDPTYHKTRVKLLSTCLQDYCSA